MKILIVGSSFAIVPAYTILKNAGYIVHSCGSRPDEPLAKVAHKFHLCDYSNHNALKNLILKYNFTAIVPDCNDKSYEACSIMASEFNFKGFDSPEVTDIILNKAKYRDLLYRIGIPCPRFIFEFPSNFKKLSFPLLLKPINSYSGMGIKILNNNTDYDETKSMLLKKGLDREYLIEEFIHGDLYSHSAFVVNGEIISDFFVEEFCTTYSYQVNLSNHAIKLDNILKNKIRLDVKKIISKLNLSDGLFHTQLIINSKFEYFFIESTRRCPGDMYYKLIEKITGFNYLNNYLNTFCADYIGYNAHQNLVNKSVMRYTISLPYDILYHKISFNFKNKFEFIPVKHSGEYVKSAPFGRFGIIFCELINDEEIIKLRNNIKNFIIID
jgi:formate-dependent phosphoribosylglycinamide formyltransferase (GAR transformylase)